MRGGVGRLDFGCLLERGRGFIVTLQAVVSVAEILIRVRANLVSFLKAGLVSGASVAEKFDCLLARFDGFLKLVVVVVSEAEIVVDLGTLAPLTKPAFR